LVPQLQLAQLALALESKLGKLLVLEKLLALVLEKLLALVLEKLLAQAVELMKVQVEH
jgi:hypothetical protein